MKFFTFESLLWRKLQPFVFGKIVRCSEDILLLCGAVGEGTTFSSPYLANDHGLVMRLKLVRC